MSDNLSLQDTSFEKDLRNATLDKIREIITLATIAHKFTNEEITRIKNDFRDIVTHLEESYTLWGTFPVLTYYINGYMKGLEKAHGTAIEDIQFISDIGDILKERITLLKEEAEKERHGAIRLHGQYFPMLEDINKNFWNRIKRTLL